MTLPKTASAQDASIDRPEPISSSAGRLENLLGSPYWPLGSSFLKLLNFPPAFRTNFGLGGTSAPLSISANPKDGHPEVPAETQPAADEPNQMEVDLDGSPIEDDDCSSHGFENEADGHQDDDEDDDHTLEELLVKPRSSENRNQASAGKPSLSDRLTEPSTHKHRSDRDRLSRELDYRQHSRLPFSSIPRNTNFHIKGLANLKRSGQASEPYRTSSNLIECNAKLHPWGNKRPHSTSSDTQSSYPNGKRSRLSEPSDKPSVSKKWVRDRYQDSDEEYDHRRVSKEINSHRYHWPNSHQKSDYHRKQKSVDLSTSHAGDSQDRAASASGSKKVGVQRGVTNLKGKHISQNFHDEVADRERRWMQEFKQYDTAQTAHTRSVSPFPSSHRRSPSRQSPESDEDYYTLTQIAPDLLEALHRAVFSWINRSIAEALLRLGLWLEEKKIWSPHEWGSIRIDQLEKVVDMTYDRGLAFLLWKCSSVEFMDLLQKPIQSGIFFVHQDPQSRAWYIRFGKDFTPIGLAYRPLIKGYRKHLTDSKSQLPIQAGKFVRQYIMSCPNEEDLLYLFKDDKDPMGCLKRAEKEGIIELTDQPPSHVSFGNRGGLHGNKTWFNKTSVENKYITLKPFWLSNTHLVDQPLLSSPTITAQTCDTAPNNDNDLLSNSGGKKNKQDFSNVMETQQGTGHLPAIDRRNSDNTSLSANTSSTTTDAGIEQLDRVPHDHEGEDARSRRSDDIKIIKPTSGRRSHSSDVDTLIQSVIDQLARDTSRRKKY